MPAGRRDGIVLRVRKLILLLVVLAVVLVVADRWAVRRAEREVARSLQRSEDLTRTPDVTIAGFPFLTQAVRGRYRQVDVTLRDVPGEQGVRVDRLETRLRGVRLPLREVTGGAVQQVPVDRADATAVVGFAALDAAVDAQVPSDRLTVDVGAGSTAERLSVRGRVRAPVVGSVDVSGEARLRVRDGALVVDVVPDSLNVPGPVRQTVARLLDLSFALPPLPFGFEPTSVAVGPGGITVTATATDVVLK